MAANGFATMLHRNTNKITTILVYAVLEWVLILLLLLNSLFSYSIAKFADYFGLKHPCLLCSRVDHVLDRGKDVNSIRADSICDHHASEISKLGYCRSHRKLAKSGEMCENCSSSTFVEEGTGLSCSCCNGALLKPSWCNTEGASREIESNGAKKCDSSSGTEDHTDEGAADEHQIISDIDCFSIREVTSEEECSKSLSNFRWAEKESNGDAKESCDSNKFTRICLVEDSWIEVIDLQCMRYDYPCDSSDRLNLIDLTDASTSENPKLPNLVEEERHLGLVLQLAIVEESGQNNSEPETKEESDELPPASDAEDTTNDKVTEHLEASSVLVTCEKGNDDLAQQHDDLPSADQDGPKIPDLAILENAADSGAKDINPTLNLEAEAEEEKLPDTPTSLESLQNWQRKLLLSEKRDSSIEESLDGSMLGEIMDGADGVITMDRLKTALTAERKALRALYAELEEERSASAIAANQTMAMITRLQEEKAAMQMEALQYQRMMEEQAEYDQEALQLLNELMVKREKEKQDLESELEVYREKLSEYEAMERLRIGSKVLDTDDDELSVDLNRELRDQSGNEENNMPTPSDEVIDLEELTTDCLKNMSELDYSLAEFEEEKLSILDQLKYLEEKLLMMSNEGGESLQLDVIGSDEENPSLLCEDGSMRKMARRLLPLLDAAADEDEEVGIGSQDPEPQDMPSSEFGESEREAKRIDVVDEVDRVYERLQALEEDREFLTHCMSSVKKGAEGTNLLQEILHHLRDLKNVELRARNIEDE